MYIVTSGTSDSPCGFVANSVFQVTSSPPRFAVSCNKENFSASVIQLSGKFSVSVLSSNAPASLITDFGFRSGKDYNKFQNTSFIVGETGVPVMTEHCVSYFLCTLINVFDVGTHLLFIGEVVSATILNESAESMTYSHYRREIRGASPAKAPTYIQAEQIIDKDEHSRAFKQYKCRVCGYIYDEKEGDPTQQIPQGTRFDDLPQNWLCPLCKTGKYDFD